jgi:hypothetical protein
MTPRQRYKAADVLLDEWDMTGDPQLLAAARRHAAIAEGHRIVCRDTRWEVVPCGTGS